MSDIQFKSVYRNNYNRCDVSGPDLSNGLSNEVDDAYKKWLIRRGFAKEEQVFQYGNPEKRLRGAAARSVKTAKAKKGPGFKAHTNIVGKAYATRDSGKRAIRRFVAQNPGLTTDDFDVRKIDWGCYKVVQKNDTKTLAMPESSANLISDEDAKNNRIKESKRPSELFLAELEERVAIGKI